MHYYDKSPERVGFLLPFLCHFGNFDYIVKEKLESIFPFIKLYKSNLKEEFTNK